MSACNLVCSSGLVGVPSPSGTDLEGFLVSVVRRHVQGEALVCTHVPEMHNAAYYATPS